MRNIILILLLHCLGSYSQQNYSTSFITSEFRTDANSVIREQSIQITIASQKSYSIVKRVVVTVLNKNGIKNIDAKEYYSESKKIKKIQAIILDSNGNEIKKIKQKDFVDQSVADGFSLMLSGRVLYLNYTPTAYPFTLIFESEVESKNTAFIPKWYPINDYFESVENSEFKIEYPSDLGFKYKELNIEGYAIEKTEHTNSLHYKVSNINSLKKENDAPPFQKIVPNVSFSLEKFNLEEIEGNAKSWKEYGIWYSEKLAQGISDIPNKTKSKIIELVGAEKDPINKAKIIYNFLQEHTRYISVQIGIGGWKPMMAKDVDNLGYGDCKALTNYAKSLLEVVGVKSYYTLIYGDSEKRDIDNDFVSMQGNHMILSIPVDNHYVWLECTSQTSPFGFCGDFTDGRNALVIKPDGGEIVKTNTFSESDNLKSYKGSYQINEKGMLTGNLTIKSKGLQYDWEQAKVRLSSEDQIKKYKQEFSNINNFILKDIKQNNDKNNIEFTEELEFEAESYAQNFNQKLMFVLNPFNQNSYVPKRYKLRKFPFEIQRGYTDEDQIEIVLPDGYEIEAKPDDIEINNEFGYYKIQLSITDSKRILYKRKLIIKEGFYESLKYETYRNFREKIAKSDNLKIVITKSL
ncbi:DUF3857 domain-containing protein [uncultured Flavobacterium sp.]|uniref:DUF3857 domain-containing protein n=1 Tax=uncultured Flavobacterium sp. TaxID=165435 RepID=UPI0030CA51B8|tara:strand:- start:241 stop:2139 length:1899 start_codon:yes stop_codon:yes gene_type:complete